MRPGTNGREFNLKFLEMGDSHRRIWHAVRGNHRQLRIQGVDISVEPLADQNAYFAGEYPIIELPAASQLSNRQHWQDAP
jgi:hypothetical protein